MTSNRTTRVQGLRTSGAAGPHRDTVTRTELEREAIEDQLAGTDEDEDEED